MLYYTNNLSGTKEWFVFIGKKLLSIELTYDREGWRKKTLSGDILPDKYIESYRAESIMDYRNLIKSIFSKEKI